MVQHFKQQAKQDLLGLKIIDFENAALRSDPRQTAQLKKQYSEFIKNAISEIGNAAGSQPLVSFEDHKWLFGQAMRALWGKEGFAKAKGDVTLLSQALSTRTFDCDTSCFVISDILSQFGVKTKIVSLPSHAVLRIDVKPRKMVEKPAAFYLETNLFRLTQGTVEFFIYPTEAAFRTAYPVSYGGMDPDVFPNSMVCSNIGAFLQSAGRGLESHGNQKAASQKYNESIKYFRMAMSLNNKDANAYFGMGEGYRSLRDYETALAYFKKSLEINPNQVKAYNNIGIIYMIRLPSNDKSETERNLKTAVEYLKKALALDPKYMQALANLGEADALLKELHGAENYKNGSNRGKKTKQRPDDAN
ncbi:MAG: tetratricopeptide repeat protein [Candidatus Micrarchaeia archaeon]